MSLVVSSSLGSLVAEHVARWGAASAETGAFLLASEDDGAADTVAWPGVKGVVRRRDAFAVSGVALARLFDWASVTGRSVVAMLHSHGRHAFLSDVDLDHGFSVPGFVSGIVPHYKAPPCDLRQWGWWRFDEGRWVDTTPPIEAELTVVQVVFDEDGVR